VRQLYRTLQNLTYAARASSARLAPFSLPILYKLCAILDSRNEIEIGLKLQILLVGFLSVPDEAVK